MIFFLFTYSLEVGSATIYGMVVKLRNRMMLNSFLSRKGEPHQPTLEVIDLLQAKVMVCGFSGVQKRLDFEVFHQPVIFRDVGLRSLFTCMMKCQPEEPSKFQSFLAFFLTVGYMNLAGGFK